MSDIFICYSRTDSAIAKRLTEILEVEGWSVYLDVVTRIGMRWDQEIENQLHAAKAVVALWSAQSRKSENVLDEAEHGKKMNKLFPAWIEKVEPPYGFGRIQTADLIAWKGERNHPGLMQLLAALRGHLGVDTFSPSNESSLAAGRPKRDFQRLAFEVEEAVEFDLCDLVEQTIQNTTNDLKGIKVFPLYPEKPLWVYATRGGITYVFEELLINAWKGIPSDDKLKIIEERAEMQVRIEFSRQQDSAVCVVSDNGTGIPGELIEYLFKKPSSGRRGGTGLGLYIVKQILDQNHAKIELLFTNKPTGFNGACFKITIPLSSNSIMGVRRPPEILIVEDTPNLRINLSKKLTDSGFICELVQNEYQAMDKLSSTLRTIVADINLSEAGGSLTGGILLATKLEGRKIPIILISADPWYYLPDKDSQQFKDMQLKLSIDSVIDRNNSTFYKELIKALKKIINR